MTPPAPKHDFAAQLAFSTNAFKKYSLEQAIDAIAAAGYRGVEIMADVPHAYPPDIDAARLKAIAARIASGALRVSNVNAFTLFACGDTYHPTWIEADPALRRKRIEHTRACIDLAAKLGSRTISLQPGGPLIGTGLSRADASRLFADGLSQVLPAARSANIILAVEPEPGLLIQSSDEYLEFKNDYFRDEALVRMNCDIGHLFCVGQDPAEVILEMPGQIAHLHLEDIGQNRVHQHLAPGKGAIDFASIFAALAKISYDGWITVELYPYDATPAEVAKSAWEYLQKFVAP